MGVSEEEIEKANKLVLERFFCPPDCEAEFNTEWNVPLFKEKEKEVEEFVRMPDGRWRWLRKVEPERSVARTFVRRERVHRER